jgi:hypothetical protein
MPNILLVVGSEVDAFQRKSLARSFLCASDRQDIALETTNNQFQMLQI